MITNSDAQMNNARAQRDECLSSLPIFHSWNVNYALKVLTRAFYLTSYLFLLRKVLKSLTNISANKTRRYKAASGLNKDEATCGISINFFQKKNKVFFLCSVDVRKVAYNNRNGNKPGRKNNSYSYVKET